MSTYFVKPYAFEAFQITKETRSDNSSWPGWLHDAWQKDPSERGSVFPEGYPDSDGNDRLVVHTPSKRMVVQWGGYIIMNAAGDLFEVDEGSFVDEFVKPEQLSDGYHTFEELYEFRKLYNAALFNEWHKGKYFSDYPRPEVFKSWKHHDGNECFGGGWFIVVAVLPGGQISNHYKAEDWDLFKIPEVEKAKYPWDGHTSQDVVKRLKEIL